MWWDGEVGGGGIRGGCMSVARVGFEDVNGRGCGIGGPASFALSTCQK